MKSLCILSFLIVSLGVSVAEEAARAQFIKDVYGGQENFDIVMTAPKVMACLLTPPKSHDGRVMDDPNAYKAKGEIITLSTVKQKELREVFGDAGLDLPDVRKACIPIYGIRFIFYSEKGTVALNLCMNCQIMLVTRDGKPVGGANFDPVYGVLLTLSKEVFPRDKELQALK